MNQALIEVCEMLAKEFNDKRIYIAGGAVRDYIHGRDIKDYDIYIGVGRSTMNVGIAAAMSNIRDNNYDIIVEAKGETYHPEVKTVYYLHHKDIVCDLIVFDNSSYSMEDYINEVYDIGLCEAYLNMQGQIHVSPRFKEDMHNKTITCYMKHTMVNNNLRVYGVYKTFMDHVPRLMRKYPGYEVKIKYEDENECNKRFLHFEMEQRRQTRSSGFQSVGSDWSSNSIWRCSASGGYTIRHGYAHGESSGAFRSYGSTSYKEPEDSRKGFLISVNNIAALVGDNQVKNSLNSVELLLLS